jgi:hypothetical protein
MHGGFMLINYCLTCAFHEEKGENGERLSYCSRENCYSQFSKCLSKHALQRFLDQEALSAKKKESTAVV